MATKTDRPAHRAESKGFEGVTVATDATPVSLADAARDWSKLDHLPSRQGAGHVGPNRPVGGDGSFPAGGGRRLPDGTDESVSKLSFPGGGTQVLALTPNPILRAAGVKTVDAEAVDSPMVLVRSKNDAKREIRDHRRKQTAEDAIAGLTKDNRIWTLSKGQYGVIDVLRAALAFVGPCHMSISTWTAARNEILVLDELKKAGAILSCRWLLDGTFARRDPEAAHQIRLTFGIEAIRVTQVHAKFALFVNDEWQLVVLTSGNLNMNPRIENFEMAHDPELCQFLTVILDEIWHKQRRTLIDARPADIRRFFTDEL